MSSAQVFRNLLQPIARRVRTMITRAVVNRVNDSLMCQGLQVGLLADEVKDGVEHFQEYGFTAHPYEGAEGVFLSVGGQRAHGIVVSVTDRRYRPTDMGEGDVCLYTAQGERVYIEDSGDLVNLGAKSGAEFVALSEKTKTEIENLRATVDTLVSDINTLKGIFNTWTPVLNDGGGALRVLLVAAPDWTTSTISAPPAVNAPAATKVKAT